MEPPAPYNVRRPMPERTDEELVALARSGEAYAFAVLVRRYEQPLYSYLRRLCGNASEAEDLFQETFLKVHVNLHQFQEGRPFRPWVYRIATNVCRDRQRYRKRRPQVSLETPIGDGGEGGRLADLVASEAPAPDAQAQASETSARLEAAVAALPVKHRAVFLMARYEGLAYEEIARALRVPVGTVKSRMHKAVQHLLAAMEDKD
ncbi:MAG: RNA polymerase sigma factor [Candidatus Hydrogenedentes bacterium]|nr:RNA polymerase sigma factor [Candidatus Hydrogenedentota bacterium]